MRRLIRYLLTAAGLLAAAAVYGVEDVPAECRNALTSDSQAWALARVDEAVAALEAGDLDSASDALYRAEGAFPRAADISISTRCLGPTAYRRIFDTRKRLALARADAALADGNRFRGQGSAAFWLVQGRATERLRLLLTDLPDETNEMNFLFGLLDGELSESSSLSLGGDLPAYDFEAESDWHDDVRGLQASLISLAGDRSDELLINEAELWNAPPTDLEQQAGAGMAQAESMLIAMAGGGEAAELLPRGDRPVASYRAPRSIQLLGRAMGYAGSQEDAGAVRARLESRAAELLALARDETVAIDVRDSLYEYAVRLYGMADGSEVRASVEAERARFQPRLEAAATARSAAMDEYAEKLKSRLPSAEAMRAAEEKMRKSDAEQAEFNTEADALEAELGFE